MCPLLLWTAVKNTVQAHLQKLMKEKDKVATRLKTIEKDHALWKRRCASMANGITLVLDVISPDQSVVPVAEQLGLVDKCRMAFGWLQAFVKDSAEYTGAYVLSLVQAHYPWLDLQCLEGGYPKNFTPEAAEQLVEAQTTLLGKLTGDLKLCEEPPSLVQGAPVTPSTSHTSTTSSRRTVEPAATTS